MDTSDMNFRYLFIKIVNPQGIVAKRLISLYRIQNGVYFDCSRDVAFRLGYNSLFERDKEYSSYAGINLEANRFEFWSDYWNINAHYDYKNQDLLIMSNDPFLIAGLTGSGISREAVYDCLIFGRPYKSGSYFEGIRKLPSCKNGQISLKTDDLEVQTKSHPYWRDLLGEYEVRDISQMLIEDFKNAASTLAGREAMLQFSGGSDSVTIFSAMRQVGMGFNCISYSTTENSDQRISRFCKKFGVSIQIFDVDEDGVNLEESLSLSAGLAPTPRFTSLYRHIEPGFLFDGYAISKGDFSDAYIHPVLQDLIRMKGRESITRYYNGKDNQGMDHLYQYWIEKYARDFGDIFVQDGLEKIQEYTMDYINQNINGAVITPALQMGFSTQSYFLSLQFILAYFNLGMGFASTLSLRPDYPGYRKSAIVLAGISSHLDSNVYRHILDKNLSFLEIKRWSVRDRIVYKLRKGIRKLKSLPAKSIGDNSVPTEMHETDFLCKYGIAIAKIERTRSLDLLLGVISRIPMNLDHSAIGKNITPSDSKPEPAKIKK